MRETGRCLEFPFQRREASVEWRGSMLPSVCEAVDPRLLKGGWCDSCPPLGPRDLRASQASPVLLAHWYRHSRRQVCSPNSCPEVEEVWMLNNRAVIGNWFVHLPTVWVKVSRWCLASYLPSTITSFSLSFPLDLSLSLCSFPSLSFPSLSLVRLPQHLQQHENAVEGDACYYHCVLCNYSTKAKLNLIQHVRSMKHQRSESLRKLQRLQKGLPEEEEDLSSIFTIRKCPSSDTGQNTPLGLAFSVSLWYFFFLLSWCLCLHICVLHTITHSHAQLRIVINNLHPQLFKGFPLSRKIPHRLNVTINRYVSKLNDSFFCLPFCFICS